MKLPLLVMMPCCWRITFNAVKRNKY